MGRCLVVALFVSACGRFGFGGYVDVDAPPDAAIHVTYAMDRMAGPPTLASIDELPAGTDGVSLREALAIAGNHAGPDRIVFDPVVFPLGTPTTIALTGGLRVTGAATTIDASATGVVLALPPGGGAVLEIDDNDATIAGIKTSGGTQGVSVTAVTGTSLQALTIDTASAEGILVAGSQTTVTDCRVDHAGPIAMRVTVASDVTIQRAFVALSAKAGVLEGIRIEQSQRVHVLDSIVDPGTAWMVDLQDTSQSEVTGNILDGGDTGVTLFGASNGNTIFRNVWIAPVYHGIYIDTAPANNTVLNNTCFNCPAGSEIAIVGTANNTETNTLISTSAADFVDPSSYDFHLAAASPSIDKATDVGQDMLPGLPERYWGGGPDLGAVESY